MTATTVRRHHGRTASGHWSFTPSGLATAPTPSWRARPMRSATPAPPRAAVGRSIPPRRWWRSAAGGAVNQAAQTITGTGDAGTTVTLFDNGSATALGTATVGAATAAGAPASRCRAMAATASCRQGYRRRRQYRQQQRGGLQPEHHRSDADRGADHRHRIVGDHITSNCADRQRACQHRGALQHRRQRDCHHRDGRRARGLVVHAERAGRWRPHHRGEPDR